jgi:hypothetical protein
MDSPEGIRVNRYTGKVTETKTKQNVNRFSLRGEKAFEPFIAPKKREFGLSFGLWRAGMITLFVVPARQAGIMDFYGFDSWAHLRWAN